MNIDTTSTYSPIHRELLICSAGQYNFNLNHYTTQVESLKSILPGRFILAEDVVAAGGNGLPPLIRSRYEQKLTALREGNRTLLSMIGGSDIEAKLYTDYIPAVPERLSSRKNNYDHDGIIRFLVCLGKNSVPDTSTKPQVTSFIRKCLEATGKIRINKLLWRLEAGTEAEPAVELLQNTRDAFIIKKNPAGKNGDAWLELARSAGTRILSRSWKNIYLGVTLPTGFPHRQKTSLVYRVTERLADPRTGTSLSTPELEVETWYSNLTESASSIIELYNSCREGETFDTEKNESNQQLS